MIGSRTIKSRVRKWAPWMIGFRPVFEHYKKKKHWQWTGSGADIAEIQRQIPARIARCTARFAKLRLKASFWHSVVDNTLGFPARTKLLIAETEARIAECEEELGLLHELLK